MERYWSLGWIIQEDLKEIEAIVVKDDIACELTAYPLCSVCLAYLKALNAAVRFSFRLWGAT